MNTDIEQVDSQPKIDTPAGDVHADVPAFQKEGLIPTGVGPTGIVNYGHKETIIPKKTADSMIALSKDLLSKHGNRSTLSKYRNNRSVILESESVVSDLLAAVEHLLDILTLDISDMEEAEILEDIRELRQARAEIISSYASEDRIDYRYHCSYKHLLLARRQLRETIEARLSKNLSCLAEIKVLRLLESRLTIIRSRYLNISSETTDPGCPKCLDDYLLNKEDDEE